MGNNKSNEYGTLHGDAKLYAAKFDDNEMFVIRKTWDDLAERNNGKGIDKDTFLQYFPLHGLLGERLFAQFDTKNRHCIDLDEFVTGLAIICRGSLDDKIHFLFAMYDVSHENFVSKGELATLINQFPKEFLQAQYPQLTNARDRQDDMAGDGGDLDEQFEDEVDFYTNHDLVERAFEECDLNHEGRLTYEEFKMFVTRNPFILEYIESIFPYNGKKDDKHLHDKTNALPHLRRISVKTTQLRHNSINGGHITVEDVAGEIFNHETTTRRAPTRSLSRMNSIRADAEEFDLTSPSPNLMIPPLTRESSTSGALSPGSVHGRPHRSMSQQSLNHFDGAFDAEELARSYLIQAMETTLNPDMRHDIQELINKYGGNIMTVENIEKEVYHKVVVMEDYLWKKGKSFFHKMTRRYYLLSGNCIYYYYRKEDIRPKGVMFIAGCLVERVKDKEMEMKGYYGFELIHQDLCSGEHHNHDRRIIFCNSEERRDKWVVAIQHAAHVVPIEDDYVIGQELGRGRFSVVCECVNKVTGVHCAVKIIDKTTIEKSEKESLRTEIAVLKLVNHPNIIKMEGLYETRKYIYIVMEMLKGGELFERIVGRPRFSEAECRRLLRPLLESVAYLHDLGIVHRDLKPENILCGEELEDLKIADFGLSKMVMPKEKMDAACGTLSYVAPEVLTFQGYGKEADLWSVGVIMFLLLCGKLPFDGDSQEIIRSTIQGDFKVNPTVWGRLSEDAKNLITSLLAKNPKDRITARDALKHPFLTQGLTRRPTMRGERSESTGIDRSGSASPAAGRSSGNRGDNYRMGIAERAGSAAAGAGAGAGTCVTLPSAATVAHALAPTPGEISEASSMESETAFN